MNQRTVVRSLTTSDGTVLGMNDGTITWSPRQGRPTRTSLDALPTVLLGLRGPMGPMDSVVVGTAEGQVTVLSLPRLEVVTTFQLASGGIRALSLIGEGQLRFLAGTQHGTVWQLDDASTNRATPLFNIEGPVSSLQLDGKLIHVRSGWMHHVHTWDGVVQTTRNTAQGYRAPRYKRLNRSYVVEPLA